MADAIISDPPRASLGRRLRKAVFATPTDAMGTLVVGALLLWLGWSILDWAVLSASFTAQSRADCSPDGACWGLITSRWRRVLAGFYPEKHLWRPALAFACLALGAGPILWRRTQVWAFVGAPVAVVAALALMDGAGVLPRAPTEYWGGLFLNVLIGMVGCVFSLPLGVLLAFGRRSGLPVIKALSVSFIEVVRGAPLITLLFMASVMLPLFLPSGMSLDRLTRAMVVITLFEAAYMAEVVRGGLAAVGRGQHEAGLSLGLGPLRTAILITTPQALRIAIPGIVGTFIGLLKDTTLVYVIALLEVTGVLRQALADFAWQGHDLEAYVFIGASFWVMCFGLSRLAAALEARYGEARANAQGRTG